MSGSQDDEKSYYHVNRGPSPLVKIGIQFGAIFSQSISWICNRWVWLVDLLGLLKLSRCGLLAVQLHLIG